MRCRKFISLLGSVAATWALEAFRQGSATMPETNATTSTLPQINIVRVKPVDSLPPNLRLSDVPIDLMKDLSLSSAQAIGGSCSEAPPPWT
jgi:hypothetical protein